MKRTLKRGISLIEILIVITIFAVLGILATRGVLLTLRGTRKSESLGKVRENINYALAVIERQIRNAGSVSPCPNTNPLVLNYADGNGASTSFSCVNVGPTGGYIASGSARLTSTDVSVTSCSFSCAPTPLGSTTLPSVTIDVTAQNPGASSIETAQVSATTTIFLRTY